MKILAIILLSILCLFPYYASGKEEKIVFAPKNGTHFLVTQTRTGTVSVGVVIIKKQELIEKKEVTILKNGENYLVKIIEKSATIYDKGQKVPLPSLLNMSSKFPIYLHVNKYGKIIAIEGASGLAKEFRKTHKDIKIPKYWSKNDIEKRVSSFWNDRFQYLHGLRFKVGIPISDRTKQPWIRLENEPQGKFIMKTFFEYIHYSGKELVKMKSEFIKDDSLEELENFNQSKTVLMENYIIEMFK